ALLPPDRSLDSGWPRPAQGPSKEPGNRGEGVIGVAMPCRSRKASPRPAGCAGGSTARASRPGPPAPGGCSEGVPVVEFYCSPHRSTMNEGAVGALHVPDEDGSLALLPIEIGAGIRPATGPAPLTRPCPADRPWRRGPARPASGPARPPGGRRRTTG